MTRRTVERAIEALSRRFSDSGLVFGHGTDNPWDEAVALVLHVTGLPDDRSVMEAEVSAPQWAHIQALAERRIGERVPLPYLIGEARFAGHDFHIEPGVVIPRSPIGQLVRNHFAPWLLEAPQAVVDVCCGSGCIGIAVALEFPEARVDLVDIAPDALALARKNVARHGLEDRVRVHRSDLLDDLPPGRWDLIISNPPYVDRVDMAALPAEYAHEPALGLAGGADGLDLVARLLEALPSRLADHGLFVCEVGASAPALLRRYPEVPFVWPDLPEGGEGVFVLAAASLPGDARGLRALEPC